MGLNKPLGLPFKGEGKPLFRNLMKALGAEFHFLDGFWLQCFQVTPLQTLALYNAIANNGEMIKPQIRFK